MAAAYDYIVKRGDTLWSIAGKYGSKISGNTRDEKISTLVSVNNIKDRNKIYVNQGINFSSKGSSNSSDSGLKIDGFGLKSDSSNGREMIVNWTWKYAGTSYKDTAGYTCEWYQWLNNKWVVNKTEINNPEDAYCQSAFTADSGATKVYFRVRPFYKNSKNEVAYWSAVGWAKSAEYAFADNPPDKLGTPTVKLDDLTLTMSYSNINPTTLGATHVKFEVVKDNKTSVYTSPALLISTTGHSVSHQYTVAEGATYTVRACAISAKKKESAWSEFSAEIQTRPTAPGEITTCERRKRSDGTYSVYLQWTKVSNATKYQVEYVTQKSDFDNAPGMIQTTATESANPYIELTNLGIGTTYYFRVRAMWGDQNSNLSEPSGIVELPFGKEPGAPTTWSTSGSTFVGKEMELHWTHNSTDGSAQTEATIAITIGDGGGEEFTFENSTNGITGGDKVPMQFKYGTAYSYEGTLYVKIDTNNVNLADKAITWKVKTAGIMLDDDKNPKYGEWSVERTIRIYTQPTLGITVPREVESFPFDIQAYTNLTDYTVQWPIGYHLRILSKSSYESVDDVGRTLMVNKGDAIFSKYFTTTETNRRLSHTMTPDQVSLDSGRSYEIWCSVDLSTGLSVVRSVDFTPVFGGYNAFTLDADIQIDDTAYTALITPTSSGGNAELAVYRREYDGTFTEIASHIPNNGTSVTDPHPALDYARYRIVAKDAASGFISFYDMPGYPVNGKAVIIQWDEEWSSFDVDGQTPTDVPWAGSMLKLAYNIDVTDKRKREVELVKYAGREHPVSYYGTHRDESSTWNVVIPASDKETIHALRRLSMWTGDVYVREPSGLGYWANITVSFNLKHRGVTVPVTLEVTRVEGGA